MCLSPKPQEGVHPAQGMELDRRHRGVAEQFLHHPNVRTSHFFLPSLRQHRPRLSADVTDIKLDEEPGAGEVWRRPRRFWGL